MDSVFNDHVFPKYKDQQVMKPQMHGFNDPTLRNFMLLDSSALVKDELKADRFDDEFIRSFLNAAKELAAAGRRATDKSGRPTQDRPLFVNDEEVVSYLEKFVEQLQLIDFDYLVENGK